MYAIIMTGGKQYKVQEGDVIDIEKLDGPAGEVVNFDQVLAISGKSGLVVGAPYIKGASVTAKIEKTGKASKIIVFKYKPKKNYRKKQGHRQPFTRVVIEKIKEKADRKVKPKTETVEVAEA